MTWARPAVTASAIPSLRNNDRAAGENAHSIEFSEDAYARAAERKELLIVPGVGHVDLYDRTTLIPFAQLTDFLRRA